MNIGFPTIKQLSALDLANPSDLKKLSSLLDAQPLLGDYYQTKLYDKILAGNGVKEDYDLLNTLRSLAKSQRNTVIPGKLNLKMQKTKFFASLTDKEKVK